MKDKNDDISYKSICGYCITRFSDIVEACEETIKFKQSDEAKKFVSIHTEYEKGIFRAWGKMTPEEVAKKEKENELDELDRLRMEFEPETIKDDEDDTTNNTPTKQGFIGRLLRLGRGPVEVPQGKKKRPFIKIGL